MKASWEQTFVELAERIVRSQGDIIQPVGSRLPVEMGETRQPPFRDRPLYPPSSSISHNSSDTMITPHPLFEMSQTTAREEARSQASGSRRGRPLQKDPGANLARRKETYRRHRSSRGLNPYIESAASTSARIYRHPGLDGQYPRPMAVYTPSSHCASLPLSDARNRSRRSEISKGRRVASIQRSPRSGLLSCPTAMANLAVGLFRAVGTALVCRSTSTSSLRTTTTRAQTRPRRGSGASRHPQHRHMQTTPQSTQLPRPPQQSQQPMQVQRPKTSRGPPSSLQLRGPDDDVNETNLQSNAYPGASSFYTARSENHRTSDVRPLPPLPTQQQPEGSTCPPSTSASARTRRRKHRRTNTDDESVSRGGRSKRSKRSRSSRDQVAPIRPTTSGRDMRPWWEKN
ncbi:hypothetical protein PG988_015914 [Apiospora saccharicola]